MLEGLLITWWRYNF